MLVLPFSFNDNLSALVWLCGLRGGILSFLSSLSFLVIGPSSFMVRISLDKITFSHSHALGILLKAVYIPGNGCVIISTDSTLLAATFIYSMVFDLTVLSLTAWKLFVASGSRSRLVTLIFQDGLIYFAIAYVSYLLLYVRSLKSSCSLTGSWPI